MDRIEGPPALRMLVLIISRKNLKKAAAILDARHIPSQYVCSGQGTASSELLDYLGLEVSDKSVLLCPMLKCMVPSLFEALNDGLHLGKPNRGVAFTFPLTGGSSVLMRTLSDETGQKILDHMERGEKQMAGEAAHSLLMVTINQGYSEEAMAAAREAGAGGGTVLRARRLGAEEPLKRWGISIQPEKELIYILVHRDQKLSIMKAISEKCGLHSEAQAMVVSIPVDAVMGLNGAPAE